MTSSAQFEGSPRRPYYTGADPERALAIGDLRARAHARMPRFVLGKKVAILVGAGARHAVDEVIAVADRLGAGAAKALLGKQVLPDDLPWVTGYIGLLGIKPSYDLMMGCDTLMIGSGFPYAEFLPKEGHARGVQIDLDPGMLSVRYPMEVPLTGDSAQTLTALLPLLEQKTDTAWRDQIAKGNADWQTTLWRRRTRSTRSASSPNSRRACPTT